jgi:hypothetical protein
MNRGLLGAEAVVTTAVDVLRTETAGSVVEPVLTLARQTAEQWAPAADRERLTALVADASATLLDHPDHRQTAARGLAATATTAEQLATLDRVAADRPDDVDLQWRRLTRLARLGRLDLAEVDALERRDRNPDAWQSALVARVSCPDVAAKREGWGTVMADPARLGFPGVRAVAQAVWLAGQEPALTGLAEEFLTGLSDLGRFGSKYAGFVTVTMFPVVEVDAAYLDRLLQAASDPGVLDVVRNRVRERADVVRRMLAARAFGR